LGTLSLFRELDVSTCDTVIVFIFACSSICKWHTVRDEASVWHSCLLSLFSACC